MNTTQFPIAGENRTAEDYRRPQRSNPAYMVVKNGDVVRHVPTGEVATVSWVGSFPGITYEVIAYTGTEKFADGAKRVWRKVDLEILS